MTNNVYVLQTRLGNSDSWENEVWVSHTRERAEKLAMDHYKAEMQMLADDDKEFATTWEDEKLRSLHASSTLDELSGWMEQHGFGELHHTGWDLIVPVRDA